MPASAVTGALGRHRGVAGRAELHPAQKDLIAHGAMQCGFCTPEFVVEALAFMGVGQLENMKSRILKAVDLQPERDF
jgi:xanthine dehydrogenase iron-sulfur cluster and FAD-binding subunit A